MSRRKKTAVFFAVVFCAASFQVLALGEIQVESVRIETQSPGNYWLVGTVRNTTSEAREVTLRAQIVFFDRAAPEGDLPVALLRKDRTEILRAGEAREVRVTLLNEGTPPRGDLRLEPLLRIRRQRLWNY